MLYGCETWSHTLREECRLRVFVNRILRGIFGSKKDENGECRRFHNEEFNSLSTEQGKRLESFTTYGDNIL